MLGMNILTRGESMSEAEQSPSVNAKISSYAVRTVMSS
jgi:hypothetical protein